jgi:hypothetical protein
MDEQEICRPELSPVVGLARGVRDARAVAEQSPKAAPAKTVPTTKTGAERIRSAASMTIIPMAAGVSRSCVAGWPKVR